MSARARRIDHTAVFVRSLDRSVAWYRDLLGIEPAFVGDTGQGIPGAFFDVGDTILALLITADPERDLSEQHFAFAVDDVDAAHDELVAQGLTIDRPPHDLQRGYIVGQRAFDVLDPDGVRVEFVQRADITINPSTLHPVGA